MSKPKVLYICHNHPSVRPGGAEAYALELYHGIREQGEFEPVLLAKGGPPYSLRRQPHSGTLLGLVNGDPNQYFLYTDGYQFEWLYGTMSGKEFYTKHFHEFLLALRPAIVHFQHTLFLGYDMIRQVKNTLSDVPILYTLHEYLPICHRQGQMVRTVNNGELCDRESPQRCHECFPDVSPQAFFMRKRFIQSHFSLVDLFLAPSHFLRERYVAWGIPEHKVLFEEYGRRPVTSPRSGNEELPRNRFGYFGQITPFKGAHLLLSAMKLLLGDGSSSGSGRRREPRMLAPMNGSSELTRPHLWVHGANLELQPGTFQNEFRALLEETRQNVTLVGQYNHADLPRLMANIDWVIVPSMWWENSPLVIQEAFACGKPVICSDIGGMAEKVTDRVNGLHFRVGDVAHLAQVIREAASTPGLWETLRQRIPPLYQMNEHVTALASHYRELLQRKTSGEYSLCKR
jgi:glycosyltransferase involved in cell wall biosynthesis